MSLIRSALIPLASSITDLRNPAAWLSNGIIGRKTVAGENVSPALALTLSSWYACIRNISEDIGKLPLYIYERLPIGGKKLAINHQLYQMLLTSPNPENTALTFRETLTGWALGWGKGIAEIERDGSGNPVGLWPIHPARVRVMRVDGVIVYDVWSPEYQPGTAIRFAAKDIIHIRGFGDDTLDGLSVARLAAESIGYSLAAQTYGAAFFGNGANPGIALEHPGKLSEAAKHNVRTSWIKNHGGPANAHGVAVLEEGMKVSKISIPPDEAQFIEVRNFQTYEMARWFRMPAHKIAQMERSTFGNIEHQSIEYVGDCLTPWSRRWEEECERKLLNPREVGRFQILHDMTALLRGDAASRSNFYRSMISAGVMTPNEAREMESLNRIDGDGGDLLYMQGAMSTLERIVEGPRAPVVSAPGDTNQAGDETKPGKDETKTEKDSQAQASLLRPIFDEAEARCRRKEQMAIADAYRKFSAITPPGAGKKQFDAWAETFYAKQAIYVEEAFRPAIRTLDTSLQKPDAYRSDRLSECAQAIRDYCTNAMNHVRVTQSLFTPDQPLAETVIAILTMENSHV